MRVSRTVAAALALATSLVGVGAWAQSSNDSTYQRNPQPEQQQPSQGSQPYGSQSQGQQGANSKLSSSDAAFLRDEARIANAKLAYGQLAQQNAYGAEARQLGQNLVNNGQNELSSLNMVAAQAGVSLPTDLRPVDQTHVSRLSQVQGQAFDSAFAQRVQASAKSELGRLQQESTAAKNANLQSLAMQEIQATQSIMNQASNVGVAERQGQGQRNQNVPQQSPSNTQDDDINPGGTNSNNPPPYPNGNVNPNNNGNRYNNGNP
jgi:hypothetical protein